MLATVLQSARPGRTTHGMDPGDVKVDVSHDKSHDKRRVSMRNEHRDPEPESVQRGKRPRRIMTVVTWTSYLPWERSRPIVAEFRTRIHSDSTH